MDKRKSTRCNLKGRQMAFAVINRGDIQVCNLINISKGGVAFAYSPSDLNLSTDLQLIDILCDNISYIKGIKAKVVSDTYLAHQKPEVQQVMKRCGMQFLDLTGGREIQLETFLNTMG